MNSPEIFKFKTKGNITLNMSLYRCENNRKNITVFYFHGGGLVSGLRNDLPKTYIENFLNSGYDFLSLDYPLAPESKLEIILNSAYEEILYFLQNHKKVFGFESQKYILFGRSAGAYLCLNLCNMLIKNYNLYPLAIISLYGYARLDEPEFNTPSNYYNKLTKVSKEMIKNIISDFPVTEDPMNRRVLLYIKGRQEGSWIKYLCKEENINDYSLDDHDFEYYPPTILAASILDPDVPYRVSKKLSKLIPNSKFLTIYSQVHDFDTDTTQNSGITTYNQILDWLEHTVTIN